MQSILTAIMLGFRHAALRLTLAMFLLLLANSTRAQAQVKEPVLGGGTGTAFVVHPDGYLITNAHVVQLGNGKLGQLKIDKVAVEVAFDTKTYTAEILGLDEQNDLALLKVDGKDLPALPLIERVEVGEEVRAFGFPLPDLIKRVSGGGVDQRDARLRVGDSKKVGANGHSNQSGQ